VCSLVSTGLSRPTCTPLADCHKQLRDSEFSWQNGFLFLLYIKAAKDTGRVTEKVSKKTPRGVKDSAKGVDKGTKDTGRATEKLAKETGRLFLSLVKGVISR
jgi:hypothetical protein